MAQITNAIIWSAGTVSLILGSNISLFKILFVIHFDRVFNMNPEHVGLAILGISLLLGIIPYGYFCFDHIVNDQVIPPAVANLIGETVVSQSITAMQIYGHCWVLINFTMLSFAVVFIPRYARRHHKPTIIAAECRPDELKTISLGRVFLFSIIFCSIGIATAIIYTSQAWDIVIYMPSPFLVVALTVCAMLIYFSLDKNVTTFIRRKTEDLLQYFELANGVHLFSFQAERRVRIHPVLP
jgi:hypothetical protein